MPLFREICNANSRAIRAFMSFTETQPLCLRRCSVASTRMEKDSMGEMSVPESALFGASTQRAVLNFPISGYRFSRPFIRALGLIKWAAAQANHDLGLLDAARSALVVQAAEEVAEGKLDEHFPLDIFQTGSGPSTNTNANEVIANRW